MGAITRLWNFSTTIQCHLSGNWRVAPYRLVLLKRKLRYQITGPMTGVYSDVTIWGVHPFFLVGFVKIP